MEVLSARRVRAPACVLTLAVLLGACGGPGDDLVAVQDLDSYQRELAAWHAERVEHLKGADGYLNLLALHWLTEGEYRLGAAPGSDVLLPQDKAPDQLGTLRVAGQQVTFTAAAGADVRLAGQPVTSLILADDAQDAADLLRHGTLGWFVIRRGERVALRVRDYAHAALDRFPGIERFDVDARWRVAAQLRRYSQPRQLAVDTVVDGLSFEPVSPGVLEFQLAGQRFELEVYGEAGDESFFVLFADATSGVTTYAAGRFLTAPWIDDRGWTVLDFNRAYNPPCAFNDFATCPIAPPRNRLAVGIKAGEKYSRELHVAGR